MLAFLGQIDKNWPKELESRIHKGGKLDLSNIKIAAPKKAEKKPAEEKKVEVQRDAELKLEISFSEVLKVQSKLQGASAIHSLASSGRPLTDCNSNSRRSSPPLVFYYQSHLQSQSESSSLIPSSNCI